MKHFPQIFTVLFHVTPQIRNRTEASCLVPCLHPVDGCLQRVDVAEWDVDGVPCLLLRLVLGFSQPTEYDGLVRPRLALVGEADAGHLDEPLVTQLPGVLWERTVKGDEGEVDRLRLV